MYILCMKYSGGQHTPLNFCYVCRLIFMISQTNTWTIFIFDMIFTNSMVDYFKVVFPVRYNFGTKFIYINNIYQINQWILQIQVYILLIYYIATNEFYRYKFIYCLYSLYFMVFNLLCKAHKMGVASYM